MLSPAVGTIVTVATVAGFAVVGLRSARRLGVGDRDRFLSARASQGPGALAFSFFASALGAWILFAPPEVGTFAGLVGIAGYALGQAAAIAVFALVGPAVRARVPSGTTLLEFVRLRFGRLPHVYVAAVSVLYMFVFLTAELTAIGGVLALLSGVEPVVAIVAVAAGTAAYTAYGGLPASLATDRWQAWLVLALALVVALAVAGGPDGALDRVRASEDAASVAVGAETFAVLVIAIVAANLFHQGFWQRTWAARDAATLVRGALGASLLIVPVVFLAGLAGMLAAAGGPLDAPSLALFRVLDGLATPLLTLGVVLALGLVASSVDTLQNALTALTSSGSGGRLGLGGARLVTVLLTIPAAAVALEGISVLRLFLVADLLAATIAVPVLLGLWRRTTRTAALAGAISGTLAVVLAGAGETGSLSGGLLLLTLPDGPSLTAFASAVIASGLATLAASAFQSRRAV